MSRVDDVLAIKLKCSLDRSGNGQRSVSAAARQAGTETAAAENTADAGLFHNAACQLRRVGFDNLHLAVSGSRFRNVAHAVIGIADLGEHQVGVEFVVGHPDGGFHCALLAGGFTESSLRVLIKLYGDRVLPLTHVEVAERVV